MELLPYTIDLSECSLYMQSLDVSVPAHCYECCRSLTNRHEMTLRVCSVVIIWYDRNINVLVRLCHLLRIHIKV